MSGNDWICSVVKGKTFVDVGGLWGTENEKASVALKAGAKEATMVDITPLGHELWKKFHERCYREGVACNRNIQANVDDPAFHERVGTFDIVHCAGVIYHCPNPLYTITQLSKITKDVLILGSTIVPLTISNEKGGITLEDNTALFVPALNDSQRAIVARFFEEVGAKMFGINLPLEHGWSLDNYAPWWYLFTTNYVRGLLEVCGFRVTAISAEWQGRAAYFLAERN